MKVDPLDFSDKVMEHEQMLKTVGLANGRIRAYALRTVNPVSVITMGLKEGVVGEEWRKLKRRRSVSRAGLEEMFRGREGCYAGLL
jgi:hypothetical protein